MLSFPLDGHDDLPAGLQRQLGDVVGCPQAPGASGTPVDDAAGPRPAAPAGIRPRDRRRARCWPARTSWSRGCNVALSRHDRERGRDRAVAARPPAGPFRAARDEAAGLVVSFNYAFEGIIYVVRTQRNMRVHFAGRGGRADGWGSLGVTRFELLALMLAVSFVLIAEMINTALEKAIDVATNSFDPMARVAKDVSAGAVLIAAVNAALIGYLVFADRLREPAGARSTRCATRRCT